MEAHGLFQSETELLERKRKELISQIMNLWRENAVDYRTLPLRYQFLLKERKEGNLKLRYNNKFYSMNYVKPGVLREYPEIPFLRILDEEIAYASLSDLNLGRLVRRLRQLNNLTTNCAYRTLRAWVADANYILNLKLRLKAVRQSLRSK